MWSAKEAKELKDLYGSVFAREGLEAAVLAVAARAIGLVAARGGTMTAEQVRGAESQIVAALKMADPGKAVRGMDAVASLLKSHASQGATVATLQAKVEELENRDAGLYEEGFSAGKESAEEELRAEVERLKGLPDLAQRKTLQDSERISALESRVVALDRDSADAMENWRLVQKRETEERVARKAAESRLAATTEALDAIRDGRRFRGEHTPEAIAKARSEATQAAENLAARERGLQRAYDNGTDAMRGAVEKWAQDYFGSVPPTLKDAMDGAAP